MRDAFLEKPHIKYDKETIPRPFFEKPNCTYLVINCLKFYTVFCCMPS